MLLLRSFVCIIFCFLVVPSFGQALKEANAYYKSKKYHEASKIYIQYAKSVSQDKKIAFQAGISCFESNQLAAAIPFLEFAAQSKKYASSSFEPLMIALAESGKCKEAIHYAKQKLLTLKQDDLNRQRYKNLILQYHNADHFNKEKPNAIVVPFPQNSQHDEFAITPHPTQLSTLYYSILSDQTEGGRRNQKGIADQHGIYRSDIVYSTKNNHEIWSTPAKINPIFNSSQHDIMIGIKENAGQLYYYKSWDLMSGTIISYPLVNEGQMTTDPGVELNTPLRLRMGDRDFYLFQDSLIIFSSLRKGGYGGMDLYVSVLKNGVWTEAKNLGPKINTAFNEITPYLAKNGKTLYYSSDHVDGMGGFDVYKSTFIAEGNDWTTIENLKPPINSIANETYFKLHTNGLAGVFCSDRKISSLGHRDIYFAYFKEELSEQLYTTRGSAISILTEKINTPELTDSIGIQIEQQVQESQEHKKLIFLDPLYYENDLFLQEQRTKQKLDNIINILQSYPKLKLRISAHAFENSPPAVNLYYAYLKSKSVSDYILSKNVAADRLQVFALGNSFPALLSEVQSSRYKLNKHIQFYITEDPTEAVHFNYSKVSAPDVMINPSYQTSIDIHTQLFYSCKIATSPQLLDHPIMKQSQQALWMRETFQGLEYYSGVFKTFAEVQKYQQQLVAELNIKLPISAFLTGQSIARHNIVDHVVGYPDLVLYLKHLNEDNKN